MNEEVFEIKRADINRIAKIMNGNKPVHISEVLPRLKSLNSIVWVCGYGDRGPMSKTRLYVIVLNMDKDILGIRES